MEPVRHGSRAGGVALVLTAAVLWSTGGVGIKSVDLPPLVLAGWRGLFALPIFVATVLAHARSVGTEPWRAARSVASSRAAWVGVVSYAAMGIAFVAATKLTTAADAIFIQYTSPVYVALLSWPLLREPVTWRDGVACLGVIVGMVLFFREGLSASAQLGNAVAIVSSFGAAGLPLALRADQRRVLHGGSWQAARLSPSLVIAAGALLSVILCAPAMIACPVPSAGTLAVVAMLGLGQIGLPYVLYGLAVPRLTAMEGALLPTLEPILNPIWVAIFHGETPGRLARIGGACVLGSVLFRAAGTKAVARVRAE